ncbi:MAG TPA: glycosyltransferase family A protein [Dongiaceae bacterium]|nr:glycosyltransferase family A protein [Dongiaceae bacterium]
MEREATDSVGVTILINNYNYARFLPAAIDSALSQTYRPLEVVVVDDGSTDESPDIIRNYGNRIRPIFKSNGGQASAFNAGFAASRGEVICLLDADDFFFPEKAERSVSALLAHPEVGWVFHPVHREDSEGHSESVPPLDKPLFIDIRDGALRGKLPGPPKPVTSEIVMSRDHSAHPSPDRGDADHRRQLSDLSRLGRGSTSRRLWRFNAFTMPTTIRCVPIAS